MTINTTTVSSSFVQNTMESDFQKLDLARGPSGQNLEASSSQKSPQGDKMAPAASSHKSPPSDKKNSSNTIPQTSPDQESATVSPLMMPVGSPPTPAPIQKAFTSLKNIWHKDYVYGTVKSTTHSSLKEQLHALYPADDLSYMPSHGNIVNEEQREYLKDQYRPNGGFGVLRGEVDGDRALKLPYVEEIPGKDLTALKSGITSSKLVLENTLNTSKFVNKSNVASPKPDKEIKVTSPPKPTVTPPDSSSKTDISFLISGKKTSREPAQAKLVTSPPRAQARVLPQDSPPKTLRFLTRSIKDGISSTGPFLEVPSSRRKRSRSPRRRHRSEANMRSTPGSLQPSTSANSSPQTSVLAKSAPRNPILAANGTPRLRRTTVQIPSTIIESHILGSENGDMGSSVGSARAGFPAPKNGVPISPTDFRKPIAEHYDRPRLERPNPPRFNAPEPTREEIVAWSEGIASPLPYRIHKSLSLNALDPITNPADQYFAPLHWDSGPDSIENLRNEYNSDVEVDTPARTPFYDPVKATFHASIRQLGMCPPGFARHGHGIVAGGNTFSVDADGSGCFAQQHGGGRGVPATPARTISQQFGGAQITPISAETTPQIAMFKDYRKAKGIGFENL